jgi:hypothetical protein
MKTNTSNIPLHHTLRRYILINLRMINSENHVMLSVDSTSFPFDERNMPATRFLALKEEAHKYTIYMEVSKIPITPVASPFRNKIVRLDLIHIQNLLCRFRSYNGQLLAAF